MQRKEEEGTEMIEGIKRFRQAVKNQRDFGSGEFRLTYGAAEEIATEIEDEFESLLWAADVPAPVDADGQVVPLTTKVMYGDDGRELEVSIFKLWNDPYAMQWRAFCTNQGGDKGYADVSNLHLTRPDSWERLEEDIKQVAVDDVCGYFGGSIDAPCDDDCPAKIAKCPCRMFVIRDVMRRTKALAGRGED